ncbi:MAG: InlB B-repeat-containing protein [Acholeplasmatales bacterium]
MGFKKTLKLLTLISFLLLILVGCGQTENNGNNKEDKIGAKIYLKDVETDVDIEIPIVKEGPLGKSESIPIPKINGYLFVGTDDFIIIEYAQPFSTYYLPYIKLDDIRPNEGRVIFKFVDEDNVMFDFVQIKGEVGTNYEFVNKYVNGRLKLVNPSQTIINVTFASDDQVIIVRYTQKTTEDYNYEYKVNYLEKNTNKVLHESKTGEHHVGTLDLVEHPVIPGYKLVANETTIEITANNSANVLNVYYNKDDNQWVTITFESGLNATFTGSTPTSYEVIKNHPLNGANQPQIKLPTITPNSGYMLDPNGSWSPTLLAFETDEEVSEDIIFYAQVVVNEEKKFNYTVYYLNFSFGNVHPNKTGTHHVGLLDLGEHPKIAGFTCTTDETTIEITADEHANILRVYYEKDDEQWATITFSPGPNAIIEGPATYEVIKNHPFNGINQRAITPPSVFPYLGYMLDPAETWSPAFKVDGTVEGDVTFVARIIPNEDLKYRYVVNYLEKDKPNNVLYNQLTGMHHVGTLDLVEHPVIPGYKLVTTETTIEITVHEYQNGLNVYYEKDPTKWAKITFKQGANATVVETQFEVIVNHPLNGANQPTITLPEIIPNYGYKVSTQPWGSEYSASLKISEATTFTSNVVVDQLIKTFTGTVKYQIEGKETFEETKTVNGYINELVTIPAYAVSGYKVKASQPTHITILEDGSAVEIVLYEKDPTKWAKITFKQGANATVVETQFEVIVNHPLNGANQPTITLPEIIPNYGYKVSTQPWGSEYSASLKISEATTFTSNVVVDQLIKTFTGTVKYQIEGKETFEETKTVNGYINELVTIPAHVVSGYKVKASQPTHITILEDGSAVEIVLYEKDPTKWAKITFKQGANATVVETQFEVIVNHPLNGANQPTITLPEITPDLGYMLNPNEENWSPTFEVDGQVTGQQIFYSQVVPNPEYWRNVTIKYIGQDLSGYYTTELDTHIISGIIDKNINIPQKGFTGFSYESTNPTTYKVTSETNQEVTVKYSRRKNAIYYLTAGGQPVPSPTYNVYYGEEVVDVFYLDCEPKKTGYTLTCWNIGDTGQPLTAGYKMPDNFINLKAQWQANSYTIVFDGNGGSGSMQNRTITYDQQIALNKNQYYKNEHDFMGWSTTPDGIPQYIDEEVVAGLVESGTITLYAVWEWWGRKITFNLNGGSLPDGITEIYVKDANFPYVLPWPTKTQGDANLEFLGWYSTNDTSGTKYKVLSVTEDYTLYAIWGDECYYIGEYPQSIMEDTALVTKLDQITPEVSSKELFTSGVESYIEEWKTVTYGGYKFEKMGGYYFKYEPIAFCKVAGDGTLYSKYILDYSTFDNGLANSNNFDTSYVKQYLNEVIKTKAGLTTTLGLLSKAQLLDPINFADDDARKATQTDYARIAIYPNRRSTPPWAGDTNFMNQYWTNTAVSGENYRVHYVSWVGGHIEGWGLGSNGVVGLRITLGD